MRLPIVQYPRVVVENLAHFALVFQTPEQVKHFCEYVTGLMSGENLKHLVGSLYFQASPQRMRSWKTGKVI